MKPEDLSLDELLEPCREFVSGPAWSTQKTAEMARRLKLVGARHRHTGHGVLAAGVCAYCGDEWPCPDAVDLKVEEG